MFCGELGPERHRALHLGLLHAESDGLVELTPGTRPPGGKVEIDRRTQREHFLPGGATGTPGWLDRLLEHARRIVAGEFTRARFDGQPREEAFVGVTPRTRAARQQGRRRVHPVAVGRRRPRRASCPPCGRSWRSGRATC